MNNNDKITELKELYSTAYRINIGMLEWLSFIKHLNEVYNNAYIHFKLVNDYFFCDDIQLYIEQINEGDKGVDTFIGTLHANIMQANEMENYLFSKRSALVN
jgi:hypothetical protein